jgi:hypothetical protein
LDLSARCGILPGGHHLVAYFSATSYTSVAMPANGYMLMVQDIKRPHLRLTSGSHPAINIGIANDGPADYKDFQLRIVAGAHRLSIRVDGQEVIGVPDADYQEGAYGFGTLYGPIRVADLTLGDPDCRPRVTATPTAPATPTPGAVAPVSVSPYPRVFTPVLTPLVTPVATWEHGCVVEPSVMKVKGRWHMTYSANAFLLGGDKPVIGLKTSRDGLHWEAYGEHPILGGGYGGVTGTAIRSSQLRVGDEFRVYFVDGRGDLRYARSADGCSYQAVSTPAVAFNLLNAEHIQSFDSAGFYHDQAADVWWMLLDGGSENTTPRFRVYLFKSSDQARTFQRAAGPLYSQLPGGRTSWGSPRALVKLGDWFHCWYLVGVPSRIYHARSPDLYNWTVDKDWVLDILPNLYGLPKANQVADTCIVESGDGRTFLYNDATDNFTPGGAIGVAIYPGTLADYAAKGDGPAATPTPSPSVTLTPGPTATVTATPRP